MSLFWGVLWSKGGCVGDRDILDALVNDMNDAPKKRVSNLADMLDERRSRLTTCIKGPFNIVLKKMKFRDLLVAYFCKCLSVTL